MEDANRLITGRHFSLHLRLIKDMYGIALDEGKAIGRSQINRMSENNNLLQFQAPESPLLCLNGSQFVSRP